LRVLLILTPALAGVVASGGCSPSNDGVTGSHGSATYRPCDPLAPPATTLGTILGVGEDANSVDYVADEARDKSGQPRVFVSSGSTLQRQFIAGWGGSGNSPNADYTFSFAPAFADANDTRALVVQIRGGAVAMALGPGNSRAFFDAAEASQTDLAVVDPGVVATFAIENLPYVVEHVADVSNGDVVVVTRPMQLDDASGWRLFYGTSDRMTEYPFDSVNADDYGEYIAFEMNGTTYHVFFNDPFVITDGGPPPGPGPGSLYTGSDSNPPFSAPAGALTVTERTPTPTSLAGFAFSCLGQP
jgi:hypothetical protein